MIEVIYYTAWLSIFTLLGLWIATDYRATRMIGYPHLFIRFWLYCRFLMFMGTAPVFYTFITLAPATATQFYTSAPDTIYELGEAMWGVDPDDV